MSSRVAPVLARGRRAHERVMIDRCVIDRETRGALDEATAAHAASTWATLYTGRCRVKGPHAGAITVTERDAGGAQQSTQWQTLVLPHGEALTVRVGDRVRVTSGSNSGLEFRVVGEVDTSTMTARSLLVEAIAS